MGEVLSFGVMDHPTTENSLRTTSMVEGYISGWMEESTMESGRKTKWMDREYSHGRMEGNII